MEHEQYRALTANDAATYRNLRLEALRVSSKSFSDSFEDEVALPLTHFTASLGDGGENFTIGCFLGEELCGFAIFRRDQRKKARHKSMIHTMYVQEKLRGRGIGERLLRQLLDRARAQSGLEQIHLWVLDPATSPATRLYEKLGFRASGPVIPSNLLIDGNYVAAGYYVLVLP